MGVAINDLILREKASEIAKTSGQTEFKLSYGYLRNFKRRIGVEFKGNNGDAYLVPSQKIYGWKIKLKELIKSFEPKNIFNADELGLFWRLQASKTYVNKEEKCKIEK